ncbi:(R,R)-butanediol dehydrogenase/meso-butanediol dehydrogenase/diacetyl reductase [Rhizobium sp. BK275]|uniref:zinc-dependent alcohol dehydrogenase n=1 Tax=unclassified Rhizobium TaxID=2613769 RepID=UPI00160AC458|nr:MULTISPECIES: alcohol dehydrogenase catalytic domain-containing protein [unclassified Rhizobium]MBB3388074.1 (R,R)-butanediol dehydrogenase/meso-butanediol dehydrogenase/diacetyl reductase [Rhizobium sp. BK275]MBB3407424.1 (R,R)-butanediol dehydrogenase/meso-butanediol dehydrogenase/diacetyl reductase [Rhizobium sp. BK316]
MKAVLFDGVGMPLKVGERPVPEPASDEVMLRIAACGICGSDLHMTEDPKTFGLNRHDVLGHEFAGEVIRCGTAVSELKPGDRVAVAPMRGCGTCDNCRKGEPAWCAEMRLIGGGYAEYTTVTARQCRILPDDLPIEEGALAEPVAVALHCVMRSGLKPGERVLILGAGPIGLLVAFWARRQGARDVIVADINRHQEDGAASVGATGFAMSGPGLAQEFRAKTGGAPDIVFECVGKRGLLDFACQLVRTHGTVVGVGLCVGGDDWDPFAALSKEIQLIFAVFFNMAEFETALSALGPGRYRPQALITGRIGFNDVPDAFEGLRHRTTQCKVLIAADAA